MAEKKVPLAQTMFESELNVLNVPMENIRYRLKNGWSKDRIYRTVVGTAGGRSHNPDHPYNAASYVYYSDDKLKQMGVRRTDTFSSEAVSKLSGR